MPSLRRDLLARVLPRLLGAGELDSPERERGLLEAAHRIRAAVGAPLPTAAVPRFSRRYELSTAHLGEGDARFPVHTIRPRSHRPRTTLVYLHGGAFVMPARGAHVRYALRLAEHLDAEVVLPDYPLAPEHTWADSHEALVADLAARTSIRDRVVVAGDSAGGGLALAVTQGLRDAGGILPSHLVLLSPWVDLTTSTPDTAALDAVDPWLSLSKLTADAEWWAGSPADLFRPEVSPALGELDGLPPTLMLCGTRDLLVPGCRMLADRAAASDWDLTYLEAPDLIHVFALLPGLPEARRAMRLTREFLG